MKTIFLKTKRRTEMRIVSWNVAGIRANLKKHCLQTFLAKNDFDIICLQETKATAEEVKIPEEISEKYPFRFWESTQGITQRKGLSGTSIWCKERPINRILPPSIDTEGRVTALEFEKFIIVCVYTPNSQCAESERFKFRVEEWDESFRNYIKLLDNIKPTIICGDLNVAHLDIDIYNPVKYKNKVAGFFDAERLQFSKHLESGFVDAFRSLHPTEGKKYTYWNQIRKTCRQNNIGWRIDYFLVSKRLEGDIKECNILSDEMGSDHCPIELCINIE